MPEREISIGNGQGIAPFRGPEHEFQEEPVIINTEPSKEIELLSRKEDLQQKFPYIHTLRFLSEAVDLDVPRTTLRNTPNREARRKLLYGFKIIQLYYTTPSLLEDIADKMGFNKNTVSKIRNKTFRSIWENSPEELKGRYPFERLQLNKKKQTLKMRMKNSTSHGGMAVSISKMLAEGKGLEEISTTLGIRKKSMTRYRSKLKKWGIHLPHFNKGYDIKQEIRRRLQDGTLTDLDAQRLLDETNLESYRKNSIGKDAIFSSLRTCILEAGFKFAPFFADKFLDELAKSGIPFRTIERVVQTGKGAGTVERHNFILRAHLERAKKVFMADPNLSQYRNTKS